MNDVIFYRRPMQQMIKSQFKYTGMGYLNHEKGFISNDYPAPDDWIFTSVMTTQRLTTECPHQQWLPSAWDYILISNHNPAPERLHSHQQWIYSTWDYILISNEYIAPETTFSSARTTQHLWLNYHQLWLPSASDYRSHKQWLPWAWDCSRDDLWAASWKFPDSTKDVGFQTQPD